MVAKSSQIRFSEGVPLCSLTSWVPLASTYQPMTYFIEWYWRWKDLWNCDWRRSIRRRAVWGHDFVEVMQRRSWYYELRLCWKWCSIFRYYSWESPSWAAKRAMGIEDTWARYLSILWFTKFLDSVRAGLLETSLGPAPILDRLQGNVTWDLVEAAWFRIADRKVEKISSKPSSSRKNIRRLPGFSYNVAENNYTETE